MGSLTRRSLFFMQFFYTCINRRTWKGTVNIKLVIYIEFEARSLIPKLGGCVMDPSAVDKPLKIDSPGGKVVRVIRVASESILCPGKVSINAARTGAC